MNNPATHFLANNLRSRKYLTNLHFSIAMEINIFYSGAYILEEMENNLYMNNDRNVQLSCSEFLLLRCRY